MSSLFGRPIVPVENPAWVSGTEIALGSMDDYVTVTVRTWRLGVPKTETLTLSEAKAKYPQYAKELEGLTTCKMPALTPEQKTEFRRMWREAAQGKRQRC